jgi:hypothetical protein
MRNRQEQGKEAPMKTLLMLLLLVVSSSVYAEDRYPFPDKPVFGVVGCRLDGTVKFADIRNGSEQMPTATLVGQPCLEVLADLSKPSDVKVGQAVAARMNGTVPDEIEELLVFPTGAGDQAAENDSRYLMAIEDVFTIGRGTVALLACELTSDGRLTVAFADGFAQPPSPGDSCIDTLYTRRATGRLIGLPFPAALVGSPTAETHEIEDCLIFDLGGGSVSAANNVPTAQLVCDYTSTVNNLVVADFHCLPGECGGALVNPGESCATAMKKVIAIIKPFKLESINATPDKTLIYPVASANLWDNP